MDRFAAAWGKASRAWGRASSRLPATFWPGRTIGRATSTCRAAATCGSRYTSPHAEVLSARGLPAADCRADVIDESHERGDLVWLEAEVRHRADGLLRAHQHRFRFQQDARQVTVLVL